MPHWQPVEELAAGLPLGQVVIHKGDEADVVGRFKQVDQLVDDDIFQAFPWLLRQLGIEPDA